MVAAQYNPVVVDTVVVVDRDSLLEEVAGHSPVVAPVVAVEGNPAVGHTLAVGHNPVAAVHNHTVGILHTARLVMHMMEVVQCTAEEARQGFSHVVGVVPHIAEIGVVTARIAVQVLWVVLLG